MNKDTFVKQFLEPEAEPEIATIRVSPSCKCGNQFVLVRSIRRSKDTKTTFTCQKCGFEVGPVISASPMTIINSWVLKVSDIITPYDLVRFIANNGVIPLICARQTPEQVNEIMQDLAKRTIEFVPNVNREDENIL